MPRKKQTVPEPTPSITLSVEVTPELYRQIQAAAKLCGYTPEEWVLMEAIENTL